MSKKLPAKVRCFTFTNFNVEAEYELGTQLRYIAWSTETCPSTGKQHHQGFCMFHCQRAHSPNNLKAIAQILGASHVEPMRGSLQQNKAYCSKEGKLHELGEAPAQGNRTDINDMVEAIKSGTKVDDITIDNPEAFHQMGRTLSRVEDIVMRTRYRTEMTTGLWLWGPTGTGKSHRAFDGFSPTTHYVKCLEDQWWDGYTGQDTVILNDFRGQISFPELLTLVDKWPHSVRRRNREPFPFTSKHVIVTSSMSPLMMYGSTLEDESYDQLTRRFEIVEIHNRTCEGATGSRSAGGPYGGGHPAASSVEVTQVVVDHGTGTDALAQKCSEGNTIPSEPSTPQPTGGKVKFLIETY